MTATRETMPAVVFSAGGEPAIGTFRAPVPQGGHLALTVRAAALTTLDALIVRGRHAFSPVSGEAVVGREAVVDGPGGGRLFLTTPSIATPFGSMAQRTLADPTLGLPVPDRIDDADAAALGNAGLAAWLPLEWRARLAQGETVLILGATGMCGRIAVAAARRLGAGRVVAVGRSISALAKLRAAGADAVVTLEDEADLTARFIEAAGGRVDVVLDYLGGPPAEAALASMAVHGRMVQIGAPLAPAIRIQALTARVGSLDVLGFAYHHAPIARQGEALAAVCAAFAGGAFALDTEHHALTDFASAWRSQLRGDRTRHVLIP